MLSNAETRQLYDRYGHAGLRSGGFRPTEFDLGNLGDLFSAFFGEDIFGGGSRTQRAAAAGTSPRRSRSISPRRPAGSRRPSPWRWQPRARRAAATGRRRGRASRPAVAAAAVDGCSRSRAASSASSCVRRRARTAAAPGRRSRALRDVPWSGQDDHRAAAVGRRSRPGSTTGSASGSRGRATRARSGPGGRRLRRRSTCGRTSVSCARGTTSSPRSTSRSSRPRSARRSRSRRSTARAELEFDPGTQPGEVRVLRGQGDAGAPGLRPGRPPGARQCRRPAAAHRRAAAPARPVRAAERTTTPTSRDEGFFEKLKSAFR